MRHRCVVLRQSARDDLREIYDYIRQQGGFGKTAKAYIRRIRDRCHKIGDIPLGSVSRDDLGPGIRMAVFERSVVILYTVDDDTVWITNILSGGRDYETLFDRRGNVPPEDFT
jgi:toxin ParE1/3/4